jgi:hypothetical protein
MELQQPAPTIRRRSVRRVLIARTDGLFCNGLEECGVGGQCDAGRDQCGPNETCDEESDTCIENP